MGKNMTMRYVIYVIAAVVICCVIQSEAMCTDVATSSGIVDIDSGDTACQAPETLEELGQGYWWCWGGHLYSMACPTGTRLNVKMNLCMWPTDMDCDLNVPVPTVAESQANTTNTTTTTTTTTTSIPPPVGSCNNETCQLPDCFCYGAAPALSQSDMPMFILLSFDDAVTISTYSQVYQQLLVEKAWNINNPNNCSIRSTFFVTDKPTDYSLVQKLHDAGHEISSHGVNHTTHDATYQEVVDEIVGMRDIIANKTSIPAESITGFRSPYLMIYDDLQFDVLRDYNFTYDSSITNVELVAGRKPLWPFTLDYPIAGDRCPNKPCPIRSHPGMWEVPMNGWVGNNTYSCGMIDGCSIIDSNVTGTIDEYVDFFQSNFDLFYEHKVPMHMFTHASMFMKDDDALPALRMFMETLTSQHDDVWFVTPSQLIDWMKNPTTKHEMMVDQRFSC